MERQIAAAGHDAMQNQAGLVPSIASPPPPPALDRETNLREV